MLLVYADIIDELVTKGKEVEAVYFASDAGLTERFPPNRLLKSFLRRIKRNSLPTSKHPNSLQVCYIASECVN